MIRVYDLMSEQTVTVGAAEPVTAAARLMRQYNIGAVPVCDDAGKLLGMVTDRDIVIRCTALGKSGGRTAVGDIMSRSLVTVDEKAHISEAAHLMAEKQVRRLPVCRDGKLVGMLSLGDLARSTDCDTEAAAALSEISRNVRRV